MDGKTQTEATRTSAVLLVAFALTFLGAWSLTMLGLLKGVCAATLAFFRRSQSALMPTASGN